MTKRIFISHSSKDEPIVKSFVDDLLIGALGIKINEIFCTSIDGSKIRSGEDWRNEIRANLKGVKISFLIISPNYKESEICLNEMGAAWVSEPMAIPLIIEPITYSTVGVILEPRQLEKLLDEKALDRLRDLIVETLEIPASEIKSDRWTGKKYEFIEKVRSHLADNPFPVPLNRGELDDVVTERDRLRESMKATVKEKLQLEKVIQDLRKEKGSQAFHKVMKSHGLGSDDEAFDGYAKAISKILDQVGGPLIRGAIFVSYSKKEITLSYANDREDISEAIANDVLEDESLKVLWGRNPQMKKLSKALKDLDTFLTRVASSEFYDSYEEQHSVVPDMKNVDFWRTAFDVTIRFS